MAPSLNNVVENTKHADALEFVKFKLETSDSIETIVNTKCSELATSKFENRRVHLEEGIIEKHIAVGSSHSITKTLQQRQ